MTQPIGLQLYTVRRPFRDDPVGTLERIREVGYDAVEFAAPLDLDYPALAARMGEIGLDCPSAHFGLADMAQRPDDVLRVAETLGCRFLVMPYVLPDQRDWGQVIEGVTRFAERATAEGRRVAYHNHDFEFEGGEGASPYDRLIAETDPALVHFELDVYWAKKAGRDPKALIERLSGRLKLLHLKDYAEDGAMTDVGSGELDFPALIAAGQAAGVEHLIVEHDAPPKPYWPSVEASLSYLRSVC